ncbi:FAD-dependent monooxygenase [uncultured Planktomarina sp.]|uniref:FAD-dependent monooxygenase n=1 Tax=uncultured Planktomarina sp. TaxID=1538529 RepID=UPI003261AE9E
MGNYKDIIISGGGIAGLSTAVAFGAAGFEVLCVDPTAPVTDRTNQGADLRTTAYLQPAQAFLQKIGLWPLLADRSAPLQIMRIVDAAGEVLVRKDFNAADISDTPFGWNLGNWDMRERLLTRLDTLPNVNFQPGVSTTSSQTRSTEARVNLSSGERVSCKMLIAADGRDSPIRRAAKIRTKRTDFGQLALSFAVSHDTPHENISTEVHKAGGPFTLVPLPDFNGKPSSAVVWMDRVNAIKEMQSLPTEAFNAAITKRSAGVLGQLEVITARSAWPIISQLSDQFFAERTAFIAEAAHVVPPIGAQGLNLSLGDIEALLDLATAAPAQIGEAEMLKSYNQARRPIAQSRVLGVGALNRASKAEGPIAARARALGLDAIHRITPLRRQLMQLGLGIR